MSEIEALKAQMKKMEARLQELEDERALRELLARYGFNADRWLDDEYTDLFTDDGAMDLSENDSEGKVMLNRWEGRKALRKWIQEAHPVGRRGCSMHVQGNNTITYIDGDTAVVNNYSIVLREQGKEVTLSTAGNNQWTFKRVNGEWKIKERRRRRVTGADGGDAYVNNMDATPR